MKKIAIGSAAALALFAGAAAASAAPATVDASGAVNSSSPVPGVATVGSGIVSNASNVSGALQVGTTFVVEFTQLDGSPVEGTTTVSSLNPDLRIDRVGKGKWRIALRKPMAPGEVNQFTWSDSHWFSVGTRDRVTVRVENVVGGDDVKPQNDINSYDNGGRGF